MFLALALAKFNEGQAPESTYSISYVSNLTPKFKIQTRFGRIRKFFCRPFATVTIKYCLLIICVAELSNWPIL